MWIRTDNDLRDAWSLLSKGSGSLWFHGVKESRKQSISDEEPDVVVSQPPNKKKKLHKGSSASTVIPVDDDQQHMEDIKRKLHEKHGSMYTPIQYPGWAELLAINAHNSYDTPPPYPMFNGG